MTTLYEGAFAKINLTLDVLGKRADGYHDLQSVMQTISIRDDVEIDVGTGKPWRLLCSVEGIPTDEKNLAWKAAKVYCDAMDKDPEGLEIRIVKRIPAGAGLGGGSADAAAVITTKNTSAAAQSRPAYLNTMMNGEPNEPSAFWWKLRHGTIAMMATSAPT